MRKQTSSRGLRLGYLVFGWLMVALGFVGALLPVMPTTIFLILAVWAFSRSSPRFEAWLLNHKTFGPTLRNWREKGAVPRRIKVIACTGMALGLAGFFAAVHPRWPLGLAVSVVMVGLMVWMATRPEPLA